MPFPSKDLLLRIFPIPARRPLSPSTIVQPGTAAKLSGELEDLLAGKAHENRFIEPPDISLIEWDMYS